MQFGIDWSQTSTKRGAVWAFGSLIAGLLLLFSTPEKAMAAITMTGTVAGGLGLAVKD